MKQRPHDATDDQEQNTRKWPSRCPRREGWNRVAGIVTRKLDMLHYAHTLSDLRSPPSNRLEVKAVDLFEALAHLRRLPKPLLAAG